MGKEYKCIFFVFVLGNVHLFLRCQQVLSYSKIMQNREKKNHPVMLNK